MTRYEESFLELEKIVNLLLKKNKELQENVWQLEEEKRNLIEEREALRHQNQEIININSKLKIANALEGNPEHRRLMKLKINRLIKEVDLCIAELKRVSL